MDKDEVLRGLINVEIELKKGLLNYTKIIFKEKLTRGEREKIEKNLKNNNFKVSWGVTCALVR